MARQAAESGRVTKMAKSPEIPGTVVSKCRQAQEILDTLDEGAYREVMQARRVKIATPYPSISRVASEAGVSKKRLEELKRLVESIVKNRDGRRRSAKRPRSRR